MKPRISEHSGFKQGGFGGGKISTTGQWEWQVSKFEHKMDTAKDMHEYRMWQRALEQWIKENPRPKK